MAERELDITPLPDGTYLVKGKVCRKSENDSYHDIETGQIVANGGNGKHLITPETAHEMHRLRKQKARQVAIEALDNAAEELKVNKRYAGDSPGWYAIVNSMAKELLNAKGLRDKPAAAKFLAQATGILDSGGEEQTNGTGLGLDGRYLQPMPGISMLPPQILALFVTILSEEPIDAEVIDDSERRD